MKTFIADASPLAAARLMMLLDDVPGCEIVGCAQDVTACGEQIAKTSPDVVILDLDLRGGTGLTLLRMVKASHQSTTVIVLTNASSDQHRRKCLETGADHFVDKSKDFMRVPEILRSLKQRKPELRA